MQDIGYPYVTTDPEGHRFIPITTHPEGHRLPLSLLMQQDSGYPYHY